MSLAALAIRRLHDQRIAKLEAAREDPEPLDSTVPPPEIRVSQDEEITLWIATQDPPRSTTARYQVLDQPRIPTYTFPRALLSVRLHLLDHLIRALTKYFREL